MAFLNHQEKKIWRLSFFRLPFSRASFLDFSTSKKPRITATVVGFYRPSLAKPSLTTLSLPYGHRLGNVQSYVLQRSGQDSLGKNWVGFARNSDQSSSGSRRKVRVPKEICMVGKDLLGEKMLRQNLNHEILLV